MQHLKISATARGLNYLPEYYAQARGLFADHDLEVTNVARDPWTGVLDDLESGAADVALGGLWVPAMFAGSGRHYTVVGQLNHQFPMAIVTRQPAPDFTLGWLTGKTVLAPGAGGSAPYEFTAGLMREAGVDPSGTKFVRDLSTAMLVELFEAGLGDAIIADLVTATVLQDKGFGYISFEHAKAGGIMPNSVYYCRTERLDELAPALTAFVSRGRRGHGCAHRRHRGLGHRHPDRHVARRPAHRLEVGHRETAGQPHLGHHQRRPRGL